jgi:phosphoadenosine phosphosulfate reductase
LERYALCFTRLHRERAGISAALKEIDDFPLPSDHIIRKLSPLSEWSTEDVRRYTTQHDITLLKLYDKGYTSIGCEPCISLPLDLNDPRSGRCVGQKQECGIHLPGSLQ